MPIGGARETARGGAASDTLPPPTASAARLTLPTPATRAAAIDLENPQHPVEAGLEAEPTAAVSPGAALAKARRDAGMTRRQLADRLGERLWTVEEWEAGRQPVQPEKVDAIAEATGASKDLLVSGANQVEGTGVEAQQRWIRSLGPVNAPVHRPLTVDEIRDPELPRSVRGFEPAATRRWLSEVAVHYERVVAERDQLRWRVEDLEAAPPPADDHAQVVAERDELRQRIAELDAAASAPADYEEVVAERDELRGRVAQLDATVAELQASLEQRKDYDAIVGERDDLRRRLTEAEASTETEQALSRALLAASRAGEELVREAQAEADAILAAARASAAETERELELQRHALETERDAFLEALRAEALQAARDDLAALQQEAEQLVPALTALAQRIQTTARFRLDTPEDEPVDAELVDDLQARAEASGAAPPVAESD